MQKLLLFMPKAARLITADELEHMPGTDHGCELVKGRLIRMSPVGPVHGSIVVGFASMLHQHVKSRRLGDVMTEVGFKLEFDPDTVRAPDIAFIRRERTTRGSRGFVKGGPELVVEVLSSDDRPGEIREKIAEYLTHGVFVVVVVDPDDRTVTVHRPLTPPATLVEDDELDLGDVVTGFTCRVREIFE